MCAPRLGEQVTLSTSPDAGCTARVPSEVAPAWSALAKKRSPASIFLTPEWLEVARAHENTDQITLAAGDPPRGIAALARDSAGTISFAGGELTDEQDVVAAPGEAAKVAQAVARWIVGDRAPRVRLEYVPEDVPTLGVFADELSVGGYAVSRERLVTSPRVTLAADFESYVQDLGKKERHELRRKLRRFESAPGTGFRWAGSGEREAVLDRFFALHRLSKGEKASFMTDRTERFFRDIADAMVSGHACPLAKLGGRDSGGMNVYVRELARELGRRGHEVDVFTRWREKDDPRIQSLGPNARVVHIQCGPMGYWPKMDVYEHLD